MSIPSTKKLGAQLKQLRTQAGLTQEQVLQKSGLRSQQLIDLEKGRRDFKYSTLTVYLNAINGDLKIHRRKKQTAR